MLSVLANNKDIYATILFSITDQTLYQPRGHCIFHHLSSPIIHHSIIPSSIAPPIFHDPPSIIPHHHSSHHPSIIQQPSFINPSSSFIMHPQSRLPPKVSQIEVQSIHEHGKTFRVEGKRPEPGPYTHIFNHLYIYINIAHVFAYVYIYIHTVYVYQRVWISNGEDSISKPASHPITGP